MPVLPHFGDEQFGLAAKPALNRCYAIKHLRPAPVKFMCAAINALHWCWRGAITAEGSLHRIRNLAQRRTGTGCINGKREEVGAILCPFCQRCECGLAFRRIPFRLHPLDPRNLRIANRMVIDL